MTHHVGELDYGYACLELLDDKGVAQIVDLGPRDARDAEIAVDSRADIADQERIAGFGDKEGRVFGFGTLFDIFFDSSFGGIVERDTAGFVGFVGADFEM